MKIKLIYVTTYDVLMMKEALNKLRSFKKWKKMFPEGGKGHIRCWLAVYLWVVILMVGIIS